MLFFLYQLWISKIYSFNPNRTLVGLAIIKLLSKLSIFERNLLHEVLKRRKFFNFQFAQCQKFRKKPKDYRPWSLACFFLFFSFLFNCTHFAFDPWYAPKFWWRMRCVSVQMLGGYHSLILLYFWICKNE